MVMELIEIHNNFLEYAKNTFPDYPDLLITWKSEFKKLQQNLDDEYQPTQSLKAFLIVLNKLASEHFLSLQEIDEWIHLYKKEIRDFVIPYIKIENDKQTTKSANQELVAELLDQNFVESGSALLYHKLRETISKNDFVVQSEFPTALIQEKTVQATAQLRDTGNNQHLLSTEEIQQWKNLTAQAITSMDDLTADIFDIISILWMKQAAHKDQMINFHTDDALNLRRVQGRKEIAGYQTSYRKKERDDIMKRLAALTTIWIRIERDNLKFVDADSNEIDELEQVQFNPLFILDSITVAYRDSQPVGIYECKIRPGELLANFLYGSKKSSGLLAMKTLQYNPVKQKYHKRLARYLSWQWRIRQKGADYVRPYSIGGDKGLLNVMGLEDNPRYASRIKEQFEDVLDTLREDQVIKDWRYVDFEETMVEKNKPWFEEHWLTSKVRILPPSEISEPIRDSDLNALDIEAQYYEQLSFAALLKNMTEGEVASTTEMDLEVTPENMKKVRISRKKKIIEAAKEIGIAHTTLSRYENGKIISPNQSSLSKMKAWIRD